MKKHGGQAALFSLYLVWVFVIMLNNAFFASAESVPASILFLGVVFAVLLAELIAVGAMARFWIGGVSTRTIALIAFFFAAASCFASAFGSSQANFPLLLEGFIVCCIASSLCAFALVCFSLLADKRFVEKIAYVITSTAICVVPFTALVLILRGPLLLGVLGLILIAGGLLLFSAKRVRPFGLLDAKPVSSRNSDSVRVEHLEKRTDKKIRTAFFLLLFVSGFLAAYEPNTMPKTTHFPQSVENPIAFGDTSVASVMFILLFVLLMVVVLAEIIKPSIPLAGIVFVLILICTYYCLPVMASISFPVSFILIEGIAFSVLASTVLLFFEAGKGIADLIESARRFSFGMAVLVFGGLGGTALAYVFMSRMDSIPFRNELFSLLPAVLIFLALALLLVFHKDILALARETPFDRELDTSQMEHRCDLLSAMHDLTKREREVLVLLSMGRNVPGIAEALVVSPSTAKTHVLHIYKKVGVSSRQELLDLLYASEDQSS